MLLAILALAVQAVGIWPYRSPFVWDNAPFTFRDAESIARGEGFRWNPGEDPVWGASAPLWALLLSGLTRAGLTPEAAAAGAGCAFTLASSLILAVPALRCAGFLAAIWCILFSATKLVSTNRDR